MALIRTKYISIELAVKLRNEFESNVTVDDLKYSIQEGSPKVYISIPSEYCLWPSGLPPALHEIFLGEDGEKTYRLTEGVSNIIMVTGSMRWIGDRLQYSEEVFFDKDSKEIHRVKSGVVTIDKILINRKELAELNSVSESQKIKEASQVLLDCRTSERDRYVDAVMKKIEAKRKDAVAYHMIINHLRFISEADVPEKLVESVKREVARLIKNNYNNCFFALNRRPKRELEEYFLEK